MLDVAEKFFWPCDEGKGWEACKEYCHTNATFKTGADTLIHLDRLEDYVEWMKDAHSMLANTKFEIKSIAEDKKRGMVLLYAIIYADNILGEEPQPIETDYVYAMKIEENKIITWNDVDFSSNDPAISYRRKMEKDFKKS